MSEAFVDLGFARVDTDRRRRCGFPEVIFGQGKTAEQVLAIGRTILALEPVLLVSRSNEAQFALLQAEFPEAVFHKLGRCITVEREPLAKIGGTVAVICAGTSGSPSQTPRR